MRQAILAAILAMLGPRHWGPQSAYHQRASAYSFAAEKAIALEHTKLDHEIIEANAGNESSWMWTRHGAVIRGAAGEVGWHQIKPDGRALALCTDLDVFRPVDNVRCGIRLLDEARRRCGGAPENWLSGYRGGCGPSDYSRRILALVAKARPAKVLADVVP